MIIVNSSCQEVSTAHPPPHQTLNSNSPIPHSLPPPLPPRLSFPILHPHLAHPQHSLPSSPPPHQVPQHKTPSAVSDSPSKPSPRPSSPLVLSPVQIPPPPPTCSPPSLHHPHQPTSAWVVSFPIIPFGGRVVATQHVKERKEQYSRKERVYRPPPITNRR